MSAHVSHSNHLKAGHPFHLVERSHIPICVAVCLGGGLYNLAHAFNANIEPMFMLHPHAPGNIVFMTIFVSLFMYMWGEYVTNESFEYHTEEVARGLRLGFVLFIASEVMFFFSFFWAFFYLSISPAIQIGCQWPPFGITPINAWGVPLLNTLCLLLSGVTVTYAHRAVLSNDYGLAQTGLFATLCAALSFMAFQFFEYLLSPFTIADSAFGSTFFMLTGFHGFHVMLGTILLALCKLRHTNRHFTPARHVGLETSIWYWHFVDVVWLFLFAVVYVWGGSHLLFLNLLVIF
jgi:cytochrome c oxidase subunit 3